VLEKFENMNDLELALIALDRMCLTVDPETSIFVNHTRDHETNNDQLLATEQHQHTWIATAQSTKQLELLTEHDPATPVFVVGPHIAWVRSKQVDYYLLKTDPLEKVAQTARQIEEFDEDDVSNMHNMYSNPFKEEYALSKKPALSAFEMPDGVVYAVCCTGTGSKSSLYCWTKILEKRSPVLRKTPIVFRFKPKPSALADMNKIKQEEKK
jgi:signaling intermediate in Toll pathway protein